jgi:hypothetical protein
MIFHSTLLIEPFTASVQTDLMRSCPVETMVNEADDFHYIIPPTLLPKTLDPRFISKK